MDYKDFKGAAREFARVIEEFPGSPFLPEAHLGMIEAHLNAGRLADAGAGLHLFLSNFSGHPLMPKATALLKEVHERLDSEKEEGLKKAVLDEAPIPDIKTQGKRLRAVQVMLFEGKTREDIKGEMRRLKDSGIDTVIVRVFHNKGDRFHAGSDRGIRAGVYFKSSVSPVVSDALTEFAEAAHGSGLKIFAWMTTRYADYGAEDREDLRCRGYDIGKRAYKQCKGLDLFNDEAVKRLEALFSELAAYPIDGVLFQDDLVLRHNEGFGPHAERLFNMDTGVWLRPEDLYIVYARDGRVEYTELFWRWASWKNRYLLRVAERMRDAVKRERPDAKFAINLMYESVTDPAHALAWLSQDIREARAKGFDYYSIMAYHRQMEDELKKGPEEVASIIEAMAGRAIEMVGDPDKVLMKFQTIDWRTGAPLPDIEVERLIGSLKGRDGLSIALVPYRAGLPLKALSGEGGAAYALPSYKAQMRLQ
jgi:biofilm PGA synthesis lipoprotein PgaB